MEIKEKWIEALSMLTERESARVLWAIVKYERTGEVASLRNIASRIALTFIISEIESDRRKAEEAAERSEKMRSLVAKRYGTATEAPTHVDTDEGTHVDTHVTTAVENPVDTEKKQKEKSPIPPIKKDKKTTQTSLCIKKADGGTDSESTETATETPSENPKKPPKESCAKESVSPKVRYAEYVTLTEDEHSKLLAEFGEKDTGWLVDKLNAYKGSNGKKYKSDYLAIRNWVVGEMKREKSTTAQAKNGKAYKNEDYWSNGNQY